MSADQTASQFVEQLIEQDRASGQVSEAVIRQRRRLLELSLEHPDLVVAYCSRAGNPSDGRMRVLLGRVCEVAVRAQFEQRASAAHA
jgi:hypothetical protein